MDLDVNIKELIGKTLIEIKGAEKGNDDIIFVAETGEEYKMYHAQNCCECVSIEDICGDISDLLNSPILKAEESTSDKKPDGVTMEYRDSFTWTFYHIATIKGTVTLRWYGESNGYYSESVDFVRYK